MDSNDKVSVAHHMEVCYSKFKNAIGILVVVCVPALLTDYGFARLQ